MTKESIIELQKIDCNCNDCIHMIRNLEKFQESVNLHRQWQFDHYNTIRNKLIFNIEEAKRFGDNNRLATLEFELSRMRFQFDKSQCRINFGHCNKFAKDVTFIPGVCQLETQECFKHRRDYEATISES